MLCKYKNFNKIVIKIFQKFLVYRQNETVQPKQLLSFNELVRIIDYLCYISYVI